MSIGALPDRLPFPNCDFNYYRPPDWGAEVVSPDHAACTTRNGSQDGSYSVLPQPVWREEKWEIGRLWADFVRRAAAAGQALSVAGRGWQPCAARKRQTEVGSGPGGAQAPTLFLDQPFQVERTFTR